MWLMSWRKRVLVWVKGIRSASRAPQLAHDSPTTPDPSTTAEPMMTVGVAQQADRHTLQRRQPRIEQQMEDLNLNCTELDQPLQTRLLEMALNSNTVDEFKGIMYQMQTVRRHIVAAILACKPVQKEWISLLRHTYNALSDQNTVQFQREMTSQTGGKLSLNVKDEIMGLEKDLLFLEHLERAQQTRLDAGVEEVNVLDVLAPYHPISADRFREECQNCLNFLQVFVSSAATHGIKPILVTDWDGTMKDYCSQYATNLQPIYSALGLARFSQRFTRLTAVLTAGPLRGPGILDLTSLPIDGPVVFSGSWGREWWLKGRRVVHDDGIPEEGIDALERVNDEMKVLLANGEYSQFGLVGSGVQRKVDRLTLGVQTVCRHVHPELSERYQDEIRERMYRVDPDHRNLHFDPSTELEVEIVVHNDGTMWNKANGVERLIQTVGDTLKPPGRVLICGDTSSDLPMVQQAALENPEGVMSIFVGAKPEVQQKVVDIVGAEHACFVGCPDVIHAAMSILLQQSRPAAVL